MNLAGRKQHTYGKNCLLVGTSKYVKDGQQINKGIVGERENGKKEISLVNNRGHTTCLECKRRLQTRRTSRKKTSQLVC